MRVSRRRTIACAVAGAVLLAAGQAVASLPSSAPPSAARAAGASLVSEPSPLPSAAQLLRAGVLPLPGVKRLTRGDVAAAAAAHTTAAAPAAGADGPPTTAQCRRDFGAPCYSVAQLARAYGVAGARRAGWTGRGVTVVLPMWFGSPTLRRDLARFSRAYGLPAPHIQIRRYGKAPSPMPAPGDGDAPLRYVIAEELTLDASMIHGMAPDANIVVLQTSGATLDGPDGGLGEVTAAMRSYSATHPGVVFSQSYGSWENSMPKALLTALDRQVAQISGTGATMVVSNGDNGNTDGTGPAPVVPWPASSPHVTAMSATQVHLDDAGNRTAPDSVWTDAHGQGVATGGGLSQIFARPAYQDRVAAQVGAARGASDFAMDGSTDSRVIIYSTFNVLGGTISDTGGWYRPAGTSVSAPLFAGVLALARQAAGPLGNVNPALYLLGASAARRAAAGIADVTSGCNAVPGNSGYCAGPGWDLVSGNGTIGDARRFVPALAVASRAQR